MEIWQTLFAIGVVSVIIISAIILEKSLMKHIVLVIGVIILSLNFLLSPETFISNDKSWFQLTINKLLHVSLFFKISTIVAWMLVIAMIIYKLYNRLKRRIETPFRVTYFKLNGVAIDQLIRGEISEEWEELLSGKPYIIPNNVFHAIQSLLKLFSTSFSVDYIRKDGDDSSFEHDLQLSAKRKTTPFFIAADPIPFSTELNSYQDFVSLVEPIERWTIFRESGINNHTAFLKDVFGIETSIANLFMASFYKFANSDDLHKISKYHLNDRNKKYIEYLMSITEDCIPHDFCLLDLYFPDGGCSSLGWVLGIYPRDIEIRITVIENTSSNTICLEKFYYKENDNRCLRSREEDQESLHNQKSLKGNWFPPKNLKSNEKILIPLEICFVKPENWKNILGVQVNPEVHEKLIHDLTDVEEVAIPFPLMERVQQGDYYYDKPSGKMELLYLNPQKMINLLENKNTIVNLQEEYVYGTSVIINKLKVDNIIHPFRTFDPNKVFLFAGFLGACCPILYTYCLKENKWLNEGQILYGMNCEEKEAEEERQLNRFDGRVLIKEVELEVSFINFLIVKVISLNGNQRVLYPTNQKLRDPNSDYIKLSQGEEIEISFEGEPILLGDKVFLVARGYYLPIKKK